MHNPQNSLSRKPFYFLRHGETDWNRERKWQGSKDIPLNETGEAQARAVRPYVEGLGVKTICVSPLQRATRTAGLAAGHLDLRVEILDGLKEVGFGPYEGSNHHDHLWYEGWKNGLHVDGVEDYLAFIQRSLAAINQALTFEGPVLIVAHGGVFWSLRQNAGLDPDLGARNCALFKLTPPSERRPFWLHEAVNLQE